MSNDANGFDKKTIRSRQKARKITLQALYQWHMAGGDPYAIEAQYRVHNNMERVDGAFFAGLLHGVINSHQELDVTYSPFLDISLEKLSPIELNVLRMATYEFKHHPEVPWKVVLDEAVSLSRSFGANDGHRFVNGVLNKLARELRAIEVNMGQ